jgi:hypothetical protein
MEGEGRHIVEGGREKIRGSLKKERREVDSGVRVLTAAHLSRLASQSHP